MKKVLLVAMAVAAVGVLAVLAENQASPGMKLQGGEQHVGPWGGHGRTNHFGGQWGGFGRTNQFGGHPMERMERLMAWLKENDPQKHQEIVTLREQLNQKIKEAVEAYRKAHPDEKPEGPDATGAPGGAGRPGGQNKGA